MVERAAPARPMFDPDALDALIAAQATPLMIVSCDQLAMLASEVRLGNAARAALAGLAAFANVAAPAGHRPDIA